MRLRPLSACFKSLTYQGITYVFSLMHEVPWVQEKPLRPHERATFIRLGASGAYRSEGFVRVLTCVFGAGIAMALTLGGAAGAGAMPLTTSPPAVQSPTATAATSGLWGTSPWSLENGELTVGAGTLGAPEWDAYRAGITRIVFTDPTATKLPAAAQTTFSHLPNVTEIVGVGQIDSAWV